MQLFNVPAICHFEGGKWYGTPSDDKQGRTFDSCCAVKRALYDPTDATLNLLPVFQQATRNDNYKVVRKEVDVCAMAPNTDDTTQVLNEFYQINEDENNLTLKIDKQGTALCGETDTCPTGLTSAEAAIVQRNSTMLIFTTLASEPTCPGDGNLDKVVNTQTCRTGSSSQPTGYPVQGGPPNTSSWYDFNQDGNTDPGGSEDHRAELWKDLLFEVIERMLRTVKEAAIARGLFVFLS